MLFTAFERVALKALAKTNPLIEDWLSIIDDPRLTEVDLGLSSTRGAIEVIVALGVLTAERAAQVMRAEMV